MGVVVLGAIIALVLLVMALAGSNIAQRMLIFIVSLMAAALLAIWFSAARASAYRVTPSHGANGGVTDSLDEAKAALRG